MRLGRISRMEIGIVIGYTKGNMGLGRRREMGRGSWRNWNDKPSYTYS